MLGLYHLFFPLSQGRDESEKENNKKRIAKKKENNNKRIKKKKESEKDSGLEPISPGTCQRQLSVIVHREYTCSVVQGLLKPPLKEASIFGLR